ncbi:MAG TPA: hypothetical protein VEB22_07475, partial [Phycisphaerales bacterium]|nr:hypothetical protein [Phycisphaerales bacterium]
MPTPKFPITALRFLGGGMIPDVPARSLSREDVAAIITRYPYLYESPLYEPCTDKEFEQYAAE